MHLVVITPANADDSHKDQDLRSPDSDLLIMTENNFPLERPSALKLLLSEYFGSRFLVLL